MNDRQKKAIFIDKDGTLIPDIPYNVNPDLITLQEGAVQGLLSLQANGYLLVIISNQSGVALGYFAEKALEAVEEKTVRLLEENNILLNGFYYCPHHPAGIVNGYVMECECRKPKPGLIQKAAEDLNINLAISWMIGDILNDIEAGNRAGCRTVLINNGNETDWIMNEYRRPDYTTGDIREAASFILSNSSTTLN